MPESKTIVLTGASDGIGAAAARRLAADGHRLILVGRSPGKTADVARQTGAEFFTADFSALDDVRRVAAHIRGTTDNIDVLANNAGGIFGRREVTADGHEKTFQVNYLAPFLLTHLLMDELGRSRGVVVNTSSSAPRRLARFDIEDLDAEMSYSPNTAYGNAKLGNILFTRALQARSATLGIQSVAFDPGNVRTNFAAESSSWLRFIYRSPLSRLVLISPEKGGDNLVFFAEGDPGVNWVPGGFYTQTRLATEQETNPLVHDDILVEELWTRSESMLGIGS